MKIIEIKTKSITGKQYQKNVYNYYQNKKQFIYFNPSFMILQKLSQSKNILKKKYNNRIITVNNNEKLSCGT
jgi:hypothetical protein